MSGFRFPYGVKFLEDDSGGDVRFTVSIPRRDLTEQRLLAFQCVHVSQGGRPPSVKHHHEHAWLWTAQSR